MGTSTSPVLLILPTREKILVPLLFSVPMLRVPVGALVDDQGDVGPGLHVVEVGGLVVKAAVGGWTYLARGSPARPSMEAIRAVDSPQTKAPPPRLIWMSKRKAGAQDVLAQQAHLARRLDGQGDVLDGQGVLVAHVDVALAGADGIGADDHPLQHRMGVAFQQAAVHVGAGVALVGVADHVLGIAFGLAGGIPLPAGGKPAAAAAAQVGGDHLVHHRLGRHAAEHLGQGAVAADGQVVLDAGRVDQAVHAEDQAHLLFVKRHVVLVGDTFPW